MDIYVVIRLNNEFEAYKTVTAAAKAIQKDRTTVMRGIDKYGIYAAPNGIRVRKVYCA